MTEQNASQSTTQTEGASSTATTTTTSTSSGQTGEQQTTQQTGQTAQTAQTQEPVYTLTLPQESHLEASAVERLTSFAKEHKLSPEAAQKSLELVNAETKAVVDKQVADYSAKVTGWENTVKADKDLGGANYTRTLQRTKAVFDRFADAELHDAMKKTGFGNYPALVRFVEKIGAAMEADGLMPPKTPGNAEQDALDRMFPTSAAKK